ncbi:MAG: hypothetical protein E6J45_11945 [Chloroflexi bacterium]|nr:MAG: hypothetical protein E6J45_11945 [Chloroflexota bacterium]
MQSGTNDALQHIEQLSTELSHLQAELRVKDEYIEHLRATAPEMERALGHMLEQERRRARRRELVLRLPGIGRTVSGVFRAVRSWQRRGEHRP